MNDFERLGQLDLEIDKVTAVVSLDRYVANEITFHNEIQVSLTFCRIIA